jgi:hypothetical protein
MSYANSTGAFALAAALMMTIGVAQAADDAKYPNWKGEWDSINRAWAARRSSSTRPRRGVRRSRLR